MTAEYEHWYSLIKRIVDGPRPNGRPVVAAEDLDDALALFRDIVTDRDLLDDFVTFLKQQQVPSEHFGSSEPPLEELLERGPNALRHNLEALAELLIDPAGLELVADEIDDQQPAAWRDAQAQAGRAIMERHGLTVPDFRALAVAAWPFHPVQSAPSAFSEPAPDAVTATLPSDDASLARLVQEAMDEARATLKPPASYRRVVDEATMRLVGRARLSSADQLRLLEAAAKATEQMQLQEAFSAATASARAYATTEPCQDAAAVLSDRAKRLAALENSPDKDDQLAARIFRLARFAELRSKEIGNLLGRPEKQVESRLAYAVGEVDRVEQGRTP